MIKTMKFISQRSWQRYGICKGKSDLPKWTPLKMMITSSKNKRYVLEWSVSKLKLLETVDYVFVLQSIWWLDDVILKLSDYTSCDIWSAIHWLASSSSYLSKQKIFMQLIILKVWCFRFLGLSNSGCQKGGGLSC